MPPRVQRIQEDLDVRGTVVGVLGMVPAAMFALPAFGLPSLLLTGALRGVHVEDQLSKTPTQGCRQG